ncbi:MAG TPA: SRPBCC family protein [Acidimicrobiales bacterium]|nr:SRPBCC family protein [Acidimicrobiales bacterium]
MELNNEFRVGVSVPEAWKVLTDVERIAPMLPGAQLQEVEGDEYRGVVKVKVGPITAQYKGSATFIDQDEAAGRVVIKASGRDTRGQGNASATITATMTPDGDSTNVTVVTDLTVTGKVAQFGRGVLADVSAKLMGQFVDALEADLASGGAPAAAATATATTDTSAADASAADASPATDGPAAADASPAAEDGTAAATTNGRAPTSGPRKIDAPEAEPLDLLAVAGGSTLKRLLPVAGVVALLLAVILRRQFRRRR